MGKKILSIASSFFAIIGFVLVVALIWKITASALGGTNKATYESSVSTGVSNFAAPMAQERFSLFGQSSDTYTNVESDKVVVNSQDNPSFAQEARMIIKNASLSLTVKNVEETTSAVQNIATEHKGYVTSSSTRIVNEKEGSKITSMTIKVPATDFDTVLITIKPLASKVVSENTTGQDITEEFVDLTGKVKNLEATRDQLYEVMKKATKITDILEVQRELTNVTGQIEQIRGRMQYLEKNSAMATITLTLANEEKELPIVEKGWDPLGTMKGALRSLLTFLQRITDIALWVLIFFGPLLVIALVLRKLVTVIKTLRKQ